MSTIQDEPIEEEISRLHGQYARYIARGVKPAEGEFTPLSDRDFWHVYCDYATACVSMASRKAQLALDYIEVLQRHPTYNFVASLQEGDPVGNAHDAISKQVAWVGQQLNSPLFFTIRAHEIHDKEIAQDRVEHDGLRQHFYQSFNEYANALVEYTQHEIIPTRQTRAMSSKSVVDKMRGIKQNYVETAHEQIHNRAEIVGKLIIQHAAGKEPFFPMMDNKDALSREFVRGSLISLSRQISEVNAINDAEISPGGENKLIFPMLGLQSLDLEM